MSGSPSPSDMPGASAAPTPSGQEGSEPEGTDATEQPTDSGGGEKPPEDPMVELERLRHIHRDEAKWEKLAKKNLDDAKLWRENQTKVQKWDELEAKSRSELENAQRRIAELEAAQAEYALNDLRRQVAASEQVPARYVTGTTEDEMRAAAEEYKAIRQRELEDELRKRGVNPAAPASEVSGNGNPMRVPQLDRSALQGMTPKQINEAYAKGQFADALGTRK